MSLAMGIFTFINAWWIMLFFVLPFMVKPAESSKPHEYAAAPQPIRWKKMLAVNTLLSILITLVLAGVIDSHLIRVG